MDAVNRVKNARRIAPDCRRRQLSPCAYIVILAPGTNLRLPSTECVPHLRTDPTART